MTAYVERHTDHATIALEYAADAVAALKVAVPSTGRRWSPMVKTWRVDEPYVDPAVAALMATAPPVIVQDLRHQAPATDWAQALHDQLDPADRTKVFRLLTSVLHPDRGAPKDLQRQVNDAFRN